MLLVMMAAGVEGIARGLFAAIAAIPSRAKPLASLSRLDVVDVSGVGSLSAALILVTGARCTTGLSAAASIAHIEPIAKISSMPRAHDPPA